MLRFCLVLRSSIEPRLPIPHGQIVFAQPFVRVITQVPARACDPDAHRQPFETLQRAAKSPLHGRHGYEVHRASYLKLVMLHPFSLPSGAPSLRTYELSKHNRYEESNTYPRILRASWISLVIIVTLHIFSSTAG